MKQQEMRFDDGLDRHMRDPASLNGGGSVFAFLFADALGEG
jgi:hypothetical protein